MIVCPNCNHQNPDAAIQCEACYTPLPAMTTCPNCGASVQTDASFCGQCGTSLGAAAAAASIIPPTIAPELDIPDLPPPDPLVSPDPLVVQPAAQSAAKSSAQSSAPAPFTPPAPSPAAESSGSPLPSSGTFAATEAASFVPAQGAAYSGGSKTQLQIQAARLLHVQTNTAIELPVNLQVIHIGKPNDRIPPDVDVSGFPSSEIVSRIHADIRVEGDAYYIEDVGSSNGTYINNAPLPQGNRHKLRSGDRVALGKGDKVSFLFQMS